MKIQSKLKLKKYQTLNFLNQFWKKISRKYSNKVSKKALEVLKKKGFKEFESIFVKNNWERLIDSVGIAVNTIAKVFNNIANNFSEVVLNLTKNSN